MLEEVAVWGLTGPEFLALYWIGVGVVALLAGVAAGWIWAPWRRKADIGELGPYELAHLAGGSTRVFHTAVAALVSRGAVHASRTGQVTPVPDVRGADPYEDAALGSLRRTGRVTNVHTFYQEAVVSDLVRRMVQAGYATSIDRAVRVSAAVRLLFIAIGAVGVVRLVAGLANSRPIGFLVGSLVLTFVIAKVAIEPLEQVYSGPTWRGKRALAAARARGVDSGLVIGAAVLLPVALAGLTAYPDSEVSTALTAHPTSPASTGGSGSSGDGGSSCGSGCGGCGGCG